MRWIRLAWAVVLCLCVAPLWAEQVSETWRSPYGTPTSVTVDPADGSLWATTGASLMHISATGSTLRQLNGFFSPRSAAVDPRDGSVWLVDAGAYDASSGGSTGAAVLHLSSGGSVLFTGTGFDAPWALDVNGSDGSVWVADTLGSVSHLASDGSPLWQGSNWVTPVAVSVNPGDGSCWVADEGVYDDSNDTYKVSAVVHLGANGTELWRSQSQAFNAPEAVSVNSHDGSVWVADYYNSRIVHLGANAQTLWTSGGDDFCGPFALAVNKADGSVWAADSCYGELSHWSATGGLLWRSGYEDGFLGPQMVAVNTTDGTCWAGDPYWGEIVHLSAAGAITWQQGGVGEPLAVAEDWLDGSLWVAAYSDVVHLAADGHELSRTSGFTWAQSVSVNLTDGSCWVADMGSYDCVDDQFVAGRVVHLNVDGNTIWSGGDVSSPAVVSVNSRDGSCWVLDWGSCSGDFSYDNPLVLHLSATGAELWRKSGLSGPSGVSASETDGGCWVANVTDTGGDVYRYRADGSLAAQRSGFADPVVVAADPGDGSAWVGDTGLSGGAVVHLSADGTEAGRSTGDSLWYPGALAPNPMDGSCWVGDTWTGLVTHVDTSGAVRWTSPPYTSPSGLAVDPFDGACWVADEYNNQVARLTLASYVTPTAFWDVPIDQWAVVQIQACVAGKVVAGYPNGSYWPTNPVTRDQMAVYVARALSGGDQGVPLGPTTATFPDVGTGYWAFKYVEFAKAQGVVSGYPDGTYQPGNQVDRGQMAVYIARAMAEPVGEGGLAGYTPPTTPSFPDVTTDFWAYKYVEYIKGQSVTGGYPDGGYHPEHVVTRDQMAVYVSRAFGLQ